MPGACNRQPWTTTYDLAEYLPVAGRLVASDIVIPPGPNGDGLGHGWSLDEPSEQLERGVWADGRSASVAFDVLDPGALWLNWEARGGAVFKDEPQRARVLINDVEVAEIELTNRWDEGSVAIPAAAIQQGRNRAELRFATRGVPGTGEESRELAARFRFVQFAGAPDATPWVDRPRDLQVERGTEASAIVMPVNSQFEVALELDEPGRFRASLSAPQGNSADTLTVTGRIWSDGSWQELASVRFGNERLEARELEWGLPAGLFRLQLSVRGSGRRSVRWQAPRVESPSMPPAALPPPAIRAPAPLPGRPNVLIVLLDAARADAFSPFGASRPTPAIERVAAAGTVFANAEANAPWTAPSVASMFTGRFPDASGVQTWDGRLPESVPTLFELAQSAGYRTVIWSQHTVYRGNPTLRRGLDEHVLADRDGPDPLPSSEWLFADERPVMALVHLLPPHGPYDAPAPFGGRYSDWWSGEPPPLSAAYLNRLGVEGAAVEADYVRYVRDRYDENAAYADSLVGRFLDVVDGAGAWDDSLIVVLSDHGEGFHEHGRFLHTDFLHREVMHIPLVVKWPAGTGQWEPRVDAPVSLVDLLPTLSDALGLEVDGRRLQGRSLLGLARGADEPVMAMLASTLRATRQAETPRPAARLRLGDEVLVRDAVTGTVQLYDLAADPRERHDLAPARPLRAAFLAQQLQMLQMRSGLRLMEESPAGAPIELDPEVIEALRALGYIG